MKILKRVGALLCATMVLAGLAMGTASALEGPGEIGLSTDAAQFETLDNQYPLEVIGENKPGTEAVWTFGSLLPVKCSTETSRTIMMTVTPSLTIRPTYSGCKMGTVPVQVAMDDCGYYLQITGGGEADVLCPTGQKIELRAVVGGKTICRYDVYRHNAAPGNFDWSESAFGTLRLKTNQSGMKYTYVRNSTACPAGEGTYENGTYSENMEMIDWETL